MLLSLYTAVLGAQKETAAADQHLQLPIQQARSILCNNSMLLVTYAWLYSLVALCDWLLLWICCMYYVIATMVAWVLQLLLQLLCCPGTLLLRRCYALE